MKTLLPILIALCSLPGIAQQPHDFDVALQSEGALALEAQQDVLSKTRGTEARTSSLNSRLIGWLHEDYIAGSWEPTDSSRYQYSGTNGSHWYWGWLFDELTRYEYVAGAWEPIWRNSLTLDGMGQVTLYENEEYLFGAWENDYRTAYQYDGMGRITQRTYYEWDMISMAWENVERNVMVYYMDTWDYEEYTYYIWDGVAWVEDYRYVYAYDANGWLEYYEYQDWDGSFWEPVNRLTYTYDMDGNITERVQENYVAGTWENVYLYEYTYDGNGNITTETSNIWSAGNWEPSNRYAWSYDGNNNTSSLTYYNWDGTTWVENFRYLYTYTANNLQESYTAQLWVAGSWENQTKVDYTYNSYDQMTSYYVYEFVAGAWEQYYRRTYTFEEYEDGTSGMNETSLVASYAFPNPVSTNTFIQFANAQTGNAVFAVSDISGAVVEEMVLENAEANHQLLYDAANLAAGVYFYQFTVGGETSVGKFMKQ
jgi:hypothetical protein